MSENDLPRGDKLLLKGVKFHGFHGTKPAEKSLGQKFIVDLEAWLDLRLAGETDNVSDTVSYIDLYEIIKEIVEGPSQDLVERVAHLIATATLAKFPQISAVRLQVKKPHADVHGTVDFLGIEILRYQTKKI